MSRAARTRLQEGLQCCLKRLTLPHPCSDAPSTGALLQLLAAGEEHTRVAHLEWNRCAQCAPTSAEVECYVRGLWVVAAPAVTALAACVC